MKLLAPLITALFLSGCVEKTNPSWDQSAADCRYPWNQCIDGTVCAPTNQDQYACETGSDDLVAILDGTLGPDLALQDATSPTDGFGGIQFPEHGHDDEVDDEQEVNSDVDTMEASGLGLEVTLSFVSGCKIAILSIIFLNSLTLPGQR